MKISQPNNQGWDILVKKFCKFHNYFNIMLFILPIAVDGISV